MKDNGDPTQEPKTEYEQEQQSSLVPRFEPPSKLTLLPSFQLNKIYCFPKTLPQEFIIFGAFTLNFEVVYCINTANYAKYMDIKQDINLGIIEAIKKL
jgi:hypothetical protein